MRSLSTPPFLTAPTLIWDSRRRIRQLDQWSEVQVNLTDMDRPSDITKCIVPLIKSTGDLSLGREFLGTAFMVSSDRLITARHCLVDVTLADDEVIAAIFGVGDGNLQAHLVTDIVHDENFDVSHATVQGRGIDEPYLDVEVGTLAFNSDVVTAEYSGTESNQDLGDGRFAMVFNPIYRKGHMTRFYPSTIGHRAETRCFDLSFPALKGASGAPVIDDRTAKVIGMVVQNVEQQRMPAHVETVYRENGTAEESVRYFLPFAQAIRAEYLIPHVTN